MGETVRKSPPAISEEQVRSLVREVLESELLEWRVLLKQIIREQGGIAQRMDKIERTLPAAVGIIQSTAGSASGFESERRRLELFHQQMQLGGRSYIWVEGARSASYVLAEAVAGNRRRRDRVTHQKSLSVNL